VIRRVVHLLWPVHWQGLFYPVYTWNGRRLALTRRYGWSDVFAHARHLWSFSRDWDKGWRFVNTLYDGSEIF